jgi:succinate dehydrogenase hydrophobic anchor subunit
VTTLDPADRRTSRAQRRADDGVESNARLTGATAAVLLVLLAAEGATILSIRQLLSPHVFIGMLLVPPVALKLGSTFWRFARYYNGVPAYRRKGPPMWFLRALGPFVIILTVVLFASGILLVLVPTSMQSQVLFVHKASFVLWFFAMVVHVLGHLRDTARLAPADWLRRGRRRVAGAGARQGILVASLVVGVVVAVATVGQASNYHPAPHHRDGGAAGVIPAPRHG